MNIPAENRGFLSVRETAFAGKAVQLPEILFITTFPPRECGIATYSQDLINVLEKKFGDSFKCTVCALESETEHPVYTKQPAYVLNTDQRNSFVKTAFAINRNKNIHALLIQHEFGLFAKNEPDFNLFFERITKPVVFVFHTVLPRPDIAFKTRVQRMSAAATAIIVMTKNASKILIDVYGIAPDKITVIPHGTHLVPNQARESLKKKYQLAGKKVLSTFGLLSSSKGIEVTLDALPVIIVKHPEVLFLILGKTHPGVVKHEGERYRRMLEKKIADLQLAQHVRFVNEYLPLPVLLEYLQLTDVYLFTSKDPDQAVSGTFSYAVSCGCPVVSTPIPHAMEVLSSDTGLFVDFGNYDQLAGAVTSILGNPALMNNIRLNALHKMAPTAWENSAIAHANLFESLVPLTLKLNYRIPEINLIHVKRMTSDFGIFQFAKIAQPDRSSGYTLDDNARALIALCQHFAATGDTNDLVLVNTYLQFIQYCLQPNGTFLNYVSEQKIFTRQNFAENLEDSNGRAIWALGYLISFRQILPLDLVEQAVVLIRKAFPSLDKIHSTRAMAFVIKGLHYQAEKSNFHLIKTFAGRIVQMYRHERMNDWHWFENYLTYGNSLLPEALLCAYISTGDETYKAIAKESFDFLLSKIFINGKINVISNRGWMIKDKITERKAGGEQPIDVAYTIMALEKFYTVFNQQNYKQLAVISFNWFLGKNHLQQILYNPCTGGCYDGLEETYINLNQGAESTVSYLMARLTIDSIMLQQEPAPDSFKNTSIAQTEQHVCF